MNWGVFKFVLLLAVAGPPVAMYVGEQMSVGRNRSPQSAATLGTAPDEVIHFWRPTCPVSLETQARVSLLQRQGYPIRSINALQNPQLTAAYGIEATPTFVSIKAGREISRVSAGIGSKEIKKLCHGD